MNNNTKALRLRGGVSPANGGHKRSRKYGKVGACATAGRREEKIKMDIAKANGKSYGQDV